MFALDKGGGQGCAMIGQSMIDENNGATQRLSGIWMALLLLSFLVFGASLIEQIPLAVLIGVMFVVAEKSFEWGSFRLFGKAPGPDILVVIAVQRQLVRCSKRSAARRGPFDLDDTVNFLNVSKMPHRRYCAPGLLRL